MVGVSVERGTGLDITRDPRAALRQGFADGFEDLQTPSSAAYANLPTHIPGLRPATYGDSHGLPEVTQLQGLPTPARDVNHYDRSYAVAQPRPARPVEQVPRAPLPPVRQHVQAPTAA